MTDASPLLSATPCDWSNARGRTACVRLDAADGARALVSLHGAQVLSWTTADGRERLFLSDLADLSPGSAIRGGIPVIFPQFAARGPLPKHGFARTAGWRFDGVDAQANAARFVLHDSAATRAVWPHGFQATIEVAPAASSLVVALEIANTGDAPFAFTCALHTYLRVDDVARIRLDGIAGIAGTNYIDSTNGGATAREADAPLRFEGEIDRIHVDSRVDKVLRDIGHGDALRIAMEGFADTVVWNPGDALAAKMDDLAPDAFRHFVCMEPACIAVPVTLAPGARWRGVQRLLAD